MAPIGTLESGATLTEVGSVTAECLPILVNVLIAERVFVEPA